MALQEELVATHVVGAYGIAGDLAIVIRYNLLFETVDKQHWFTVREEGLDFF
jgi:ribosomal 30S subunit maturation factor RimM